METVGKHRHRLIALLSFRNQDVAMQQRSRRRLSALAGSQHKERQECPEYIFLSVHHNWLIKEYVNILFQKLTI